MSAYTSDNPCMCDCIGALSPDFFTHKQCHRHTKAHTHPHSMIQYAQSVACTVCHPRGHGKRCCARLQNSFPGVRASLDTESMRERGYVCSFFQPSPRLRLAGASLASSLLRGGILFKFRPNKRTKRRSYCAKELSIETLGMGTGVGLFILSRFILGTLYLQGLVRYLVFVCGCLGYSKSSNQRNAECDAAAVCNNLLFLCEMWVFQQIYYSIKV